MRCWTNNKQAENSNHRLERHLVPKDPATVNTTSTGVTNNCTNILNYFRSSTNRKADEEASRLLTGKLHSDVFTGISCFDGTYTLQVKDGSHPYQDQLRRVANALQEPLNSR